jgi:hypothetical protein
MDPAIFKISGTFAGSAALIASWRMSYDVSLLRF